MKLSTLHPDSKPADEVEFEKWAEPAASQDTKQRDNSDLINSKE